MRCCLVVLAVALQLGCYRYVPAEPDAVPVGAHVRAMVNTTASERLRTTFGVENNVLDGRLVAREGDVLTLFLPSVPLGSPLGARPLYQQVPVTDADVVGLDVRQLDTFRTGAAALAGGAVIAAIAVHAFSGGTGGTGSGTGGGPTENVRPWLVKLMIPLP